MRSKSHIFWVVVPVLAAASDARSAEPIPSGPDARTQAKYREDYRAHMERMLIAPLEDLFESDEWYAKRRSVFEQAVRQLVWDPRTQDVRVESWRLSEQTKNLATCDPIVLFVYALFGIDKTRYECLPKAMDKLREHGYPEELRMRAAIDMAYLMLKLEVIDGARHYYREAVSSLLLAAVEVGNDRVAQRVVFLSGAEQLITKNWHQDDLELLRAGVEDCQGCDPWLKHMILGEYEVEQAWRKRGRGWASKVTEEGWEGWRVHLTSAAEHLMKAHEIDPTNPVAASRMITVAMAGYSPPDKDERFWFDQAVSAEMDWGPAYWHYRWSLRPRWGGSHEEMYAFGVECYETGRFDTFVPYEFIRSLRDLSSDMDDYEKV